MSFGTFEAEHRHLLPFSLLLVELEAAPVFFNLELHRFEQEVAIVAEAHVLKLEKLVVAAGAHSFACCLDVSEPLLLNSVMLMLLTMPLMTLRIISVALFLFVGVGLMRRGATSSSRAIVLISVYLALSEVLGGSLAVAWSFNLTTREILVEAAGSIRLGVESQIESVGIGALSPHRGSGRRVPRCVEPLDLLELMLNVFSRGGDRRGRRFHHDFGLHKSLCLIRLGFNHLGAAQIGLSGGRLDKILLLSLSLGGLDLSLSEGILEALLVPDEGVVEGFLDRHCVKVVLVVNCF
jgi:hypothetical protein